MKRSEINAAVKYGIKTLEDNNIRLPSFGYWTWGEWEARRAETKSLMAVTLGWDITDFGSDDFEHTGSTLFTVRNGSLTDPDLGTPYAEKYILQRHAAEQEIPFHFHGTKTEDIINRGGGILMLELYNHTADNGLDRVGEITVKMDGIIKKLPAGSIVEIGKGDSITLRPGLYHRFWAKKGAGDLVVGEVSSINDDAVDNVFLNAIRFSVIEEDEPALVPLVNEYARFR